MPISSNASNNSSTSTPATPTSDSSRGRSHNPWIVETTAGPVKGHKENGVAAFRGIPYAEPPIGDRRFKRAQPKTPWREVYHADESGPYCAQYRPAPKKTGGRRFGSEDCLWLNVVVPDTAAPTGEVFNAEANRPIVIWIHGGSNVHGSAAQPLFSGEYFASSMDCVYVAVNYRVGLLGQLAVREGSFGPADAETNLGHSDLIAAIRWVHANATAFGGDANRITIMGESSGGSMVNALLATPSLQGLLRGAISQSPAGNIVHSPQHAAEWTDIAARWFHRLTRELDLPVKERTNVRISPPELSDSELQQATHDMLHADALVLGQLSDELVRYQAANPHSISGPFAPLIDGDLLPKHPLAPGATLDIPLLTGTNMNEYDMMRLEPNPRRVQRKRATNFARVHGDRGMEILEKHYSSATSRLMTGRFFGDSIFTAPTWQMARNHTAGKAWLYRLDTTTPFLRRAGIGSMHALDLPILFRRYREDKGRIALLMGGRAHLHATSVAMHNRWRAFIHEGDPGFAPYSSGFSTLIFDANFPRAEQLQTDPQSDLRQAWEQVDLSELLG
ncbi:carboxylesterase/lipase family protein [uncultured Corynebacterium sp.]|uniref:carboxylesterase/lipase family protein n=1 Tax=uncultured Corynebacterium sp. TaxID=159447 RepID=UPI0025F59738|nr:carboxylesterase family protein [uncultured Corynebacterium sp.]